MVELEKDKTDQIEGLLVIVDYAKAFDTIEWPFVEYCLKLFGYGDFIVDVIEILQKKSYSKIE